MSETADLPPGYRLTPGHSGVGYIGPDGERRGRYSSRELAEQAAVRDWQRRNAKERACLTCGDLFKSEGPHNRMCQPCRTGSRDYLGG